MRITIQVTVENQAGSSLPQVIHVGEVTRSADVDPALGLGLFAQERTPCSNRFTAWFLNEQA